MPLSIADFAPKLFLLGLPHQLLVFGTDFTPDATITVNGQDIITEFLTPDVLVGEFDGTELAAGQVNIVIQDSGNNATHPDTIDVTPPAPQRSGVAGQVEQQNAELLNCSRNALDNQRQQNFDDIVNAPDASGVRNAGKALKTTTKAIKNACRDSVLQTHKNLVDVCKNLPPG